MTVKVLVVDDEQIARQRIISLLQSRPEDFIIREASNVLDAVDVAEYFIPDIVFLDIRMPKHSGFDLLKIHNFGRAKIIFQTAYSEHAVHAFELNAENYLLKPFTRQRFCDVVDRALVNIKTPAQGLQSVAITIGKHEKLIPIEEVYCFTTKDHTTYIQLEDKSFSYQESLTSLENQLDPEDFYRVHRNAIINRRHVASWSKTYPMIVTLTNGQMIQVAKEKRRRAKEFFING
jgi:two-component system LytT family response regulator